MKNVLTIAGSDSGGGAGIQADIKTMCALGVYSMSVITSVTAQNTVAVKSVLNLDTEIVMAQLDSVFEDIRVDAVKVGMVATAELIEAISAKLLEHRAKNIVVDPVMVSKSGYRLQSEDALDSLWGLMKIAELITPNIPEAEIITNMKINTKKDLEEAAKQIVDKGVKSVLIKGGHSGTDIVEDVLYCEGELVSFSSPRVLTTNTHGTGCTLSSAIASFLAMGYELPAAIQAAKDYLTIALQNSIAVGNGIGPVGHLAALYEKANMHFERF